MTASLPAGYPGLPKKCDGVFDVFEFSAIVAPSSGAAGANLQALSDAVYEQNDK